MPWLTKRSLLCQHSSMLPSVRRKLPFPASVVNTDARKPRWFGAGGGRDKWALADARVGARVVSENGRFPARLISAIRFLGRSIQHAVAR